MTVRIRMYGQGLGDCFLLTFTPDGGAPFHVVIDCGVLKTTTGEKERMEAIVTNLRETTNGVIDLLLVTHEHYDHVCGFGYAEELWDQMTVRAVWAAWTEDPNDALAKEVARKEEERDYALALAIAAAKDYAEQARAAGLSDREVSGLQGFTQALAQLGDFHGTVLGADFAKTVDASMKFALKLADAAPVYCRPGQVHPVGDTGVLAFILGPPRSLARLSKDDPTPGAEETYTETGGHLAAGEMSATMDDAFQAALLSARGGDLPPDLRRLSDRFQPFDDAAALPWDDAPDSDFFAKSYFGAEAEPWRRIDADWLREAATFAVQYENSINNTSLAVAFELPGTGGVLLFPGDAQVGSWLSWHDITRWEPVGAAADVRELLGRTEFYKVGHHGSHNGTMKEKGLDLMGRPGKPMVAFIPTSEAMADTKKGWVMPFLPLLEALWEKTRGATFLPNPAEPSDRPGTGERQALLTSGTVRYSDEMLAEKVIKGTRIEGKVPLYVEYTLTP